MAESITVTVEASWRLSRVEFNTPYNTPGNVMGYGEVLLQESADAPAGAKMLRPRGPSPHGDDDPTTYGVMRGAMITRPISEVLEDTVDYNGTVSFSAVLDVLKLFFEKWRIEDENAPPPTMPAMTKVPGAPATSMPKPPQAGPGDALPPIEPVQTPEASSPVPPDQTVPIQARTHDNGGHPDDNASRPGGGDL